MCNSDKRGAGTMEKKLLFIAIIFLFLLTSFPMKGYSELNEQTNSDVSEYQVIPDEAIRLRILANSDSDEDQQLKREIRDKVNAEITEWVAEIADIEEARTMIENRLDEIEQIVEQTIEQSGEGQSFQVEYGKDVAFPAKVYGSFVYPAGHYEAILISLGEAKGANWWCVLFPPLCFLDFSTGTSVAEEVDEEEEEHDVEDEIDEKEMEEEKDEEKEGEEVSVKFAFLNIFNWF